MIEWPTLLLIAGTNRNVGKTTLACQIIKHVSKNQKVVAIKFTPHFHVPTLTCEVLHETANLTISRELSINSGKDSAKMLAAGASEVFYIQCADIQIPQAVGCLKTIINKDIPVICESAALRHYLIPGKFILLSGNFEPSKNIHLIKEANLHVTDFCFANLKIEYDTQGWEIEKDFPGR